MIGRRLGLCAAAPLPQRRHTRWLPAVAASAALVAAGCASEQVRWGDEAETIRPTTQNTAPTSGKPVSAKDYAARFPTDADCEAEVRRLAPRSSERALQLLRVCVDRGDFKRMSALTGDPIAGALANDASGPAVCARVVAARAGDVEADVHACARAGIPVMTLEDVLGAPDAAAGKLVIARVAVDAERKAKTETRLVETGLTDADLLPTGRRLSARMGTHAMPGGDAVVLARALKVVDDKVADDGESVAVIEVLLVAPAAERPTF